MVAATTKIVTFVSSLLILLLGLMSIPALPLLIITLLLLTPVFYGIKMWIQFLGAEEIALP